MRPIRPHTGAGMPPRGYADVRQRRQQETGFTFGRVMDATTERGRSPDCRRRTATRRPAPPVTTIGGIMRGRERKGKVILFGGGSLRPSQARAEHIRRLFLVQLR